MQALFKKRLETFSSANFITAVKFVKSAVIVHKWTLNQNDDDDDYGGFSVLAGNMQGAHEFIRQCICGSRLREGGGQVFNKDGIWCVYY